MKNNLIKSVVYLFSLVLAIGCSKDNESINTQEITVAEVKTIVEVDDIAGIADSILSDVFMDNNTTANKKTQKMPECYVGVYSDTGFVLTFNDCDAGDGKILNGTVSVAYVMAQEITSFTATYTDFSVGDILINGTRSFDFVIGSEEGSFSFSVTSDVTVVLENEDVITVTGTQNFGFTIGVSLESILYTISGNWEIGVNNDTYNVNVTETLEGNVSCTYITSGVMTLAKNGLTVTVDFGDGSCDDLATLTYPNGVNKEISLDE